MLKASSVDDVMRWVPDRRSNPVLRHSGYEKLAGAVLEQAWEDARKNTLKARSKQARQWLQERSLLLELWCSVAGVSCSRIISKATEEFGG